eukprot:CAMPEP_0115442966 /NCGR_PEP_ID=MMETSP0271-20121206/37618_1 /TAXON_ID=71861 /ORGANISM="Scrippsiella trochoidea, Strain CCMP3099" /LENGTH=32 /DNA_ID= /DNA_START= /DNA_END= /DNA_ORIENTATION=
MTAKSSTSLSVADQDFCSSSEVSTVSEPPPAL